MYILLVLFSLTLMAFCTDVKDGWKDIKPLRTDKKTVDKLLGAPEIDANGYQNYKTKDAFLQVNYSTAPCTANQLGRGKYKVPNDTVLDYIVYPKGPIKLTELKFDKEKYVKNTDGDVLNLAYYFSSNDGIMITAGLQDGVEYVTKIDFRPAKVDLENFVCQTMK